jgi:hypothetical protein
LPSAGALLVAHALLSHVHAPQGDIGGVNWFAGVVTAARRDGTFDLHYDDGDAARRKCPVPHLTTLASPF